MCATSQVRDTHLRIFHMRDLKLHNVSLGLPSMRANATCATSELRDPFLCAIFQLRGIASARYRICATLHIRDNFLLKFIPRLRVFVTLGYVRKCTYIIVQVWILQMGILRRMDVSQIDGMS